MSYQDTLMRLVRKAIDDTLARWNPFTGDSPITVPQMALPPPEQSPYAPAGASFDARKFWGRPLIEGVPAEGDAYIWNDEAAAFILGAAAGGGDESGMAAGFRAHLINDQAFGGGAFVLPMGTEDYDIGALYDAGAATWTPPAGPVAFMYRTRLTTNSSDAPTRILKNGTPIYSKTGGRYSYLGSAWTESMFFDLASGGDVYALGIDVDDSLTFIAADTFWAGMTGGGGGGTGGGGSSADSPILADMYHDAGTVHELIDQLFATIRALQGVQTSGFGYGGFGGNAFGQ